MKFKVDENLPLEVSTRLRDAGHDSLTVLDQQLGGTSDPHLISVCMTESRILVTLDTDFGNILAYPPDHLPGVIVIRTDDQSKPALFRSPAPTCVSARG